MDVLAIALDHVNEVVHIIVTSEGHVSIVHLILVHDILNHLLVDLGQWNDSVELNASSLLWVNDDVWLALVEPDADFLQLLCQLLLLSITFLAVEHHQDEVSGLSDGDDLSSTTCTISCAFNDTRQVEQLHLGLVDVEHTRDASQSCELVGGSLTRGPAKLVEEGGLTNRREANHDDSRVAILLDIKALSLRCFLAGSLLLHGLQLGKAGFQLAPMVLSVLVLLSFAHFYLDLFDLVSDTHCVFKKLYLIIIHTVYYYLVLLFK